jgi:menaquinone-dependent protoporphyrinogen oxidase
MNEAILVAYATKHGSTQEVAEAIAARLGDTGTVDLHPVSGVNDVGAYGAVVLGAPLYMGRWSGDALTFLRRNHKALAAMPVAVFALGPLDPEGKDRPGAQKQLDHALSKVHDFHPVDVALFGGRVDPAKLRFPFNRMPASDARDWDAIHVWADGLAATLRRSQAAA